MNSEELRKFIEANPELIYRIFKEARERDSLKILYISSGIASIICLNSSEFIITTINFT